MSHVLAIDLGTTGLKAAVVREDAMVVAAASRPLTNHLTADGGVEQDAEQWWRSLVDAGREAVVSSGVGGDIVAVTCTSQYMSIVPVAADGTPVGPVIMWMDHRGGAATRHLRTRDHIGVWLERHGLAPFGADDLAHIAALREHHPDAYASAAAFVEPVDAITARMVGRVTANQNTAFPLLLTDNRLHGVTAYDTDLVERSGVDPTRLPELVPMGAVLGTVRAALAADLGIPSSAVVVGGTMDSVSGAVGTGAITSARCGVVIGTTSVAMTHVPTLRADHRRALMAAPSPIAATYVVLAENGVGGKALEHVAGHLQTTAGALVDLAADVPTGADGVLFLPWLVGAMAPVPDGHARAGLLGLSLGSTRAHIARAVLEGVAMNMAVLLPAVEHFAGATFTDVTFGGGGAASPLWGQILADACARPVRRLVEPGACNARGAALLAFAALGVLDIADVPALLPIVATHAPDPAAVVVLAEARERLEAARSIASSGSA